jgi:mannose-6-phosphate isomerase
VDPLSGGVFDEVGRDGEPLTTTQRIWPLLEGTKACAVRYTRSGDAADLGWLNSFLDHLFNAYLQPDGRWREHLDREGRPRDDELPGSTGYHLILGLSEAERALQTDLARTEAPSQKRNPP